MERRDGRVFLQKPVLSSRTVCGIDLNVRTCLSVSSPHVKNKPTSNVHNLEIGFTRRRSYGTKEPLLCTRTVRRVLLHIGARFHPTCNAVERLSGIYVRNGVIPLPRLNLALRLNVKALRSGLVVVPRLHIAAIIGSSSANFECCAQGGNNRVRSILNFVGNGSRIRIFRFFAIRRPGGGVSGISARCRQNNVSTASLGKRTRTWR